MQVRIILICVVVVIITALSATIYGLDSKNKSLQEHIKVQNDRLAEQESTILSLEEALIVQQQHMDNTTLKFKKDYELLQSSIEDINTYQEKDMQSILENQKKLTNVYNTLKDDNVSITLIIQGTFNNKCEPNIKLIPISKKTKFTIFEAYN